MVNVFVRYKNGVGELAVMDKGQYHEFRIKCIDKYPPLKISEIQLIKPKRAR